jgi:hypothetical protein
LDPRIKGRSEQDESSGFLSLVIIEIRKIKLATTIIHRHQAIYQHQGEHAHL